MPIASLQLRDADNQLDLGNCAQVHTSLPQTDLDSTFRQLKSGQGKTAIKEVGFQQESRTGDEQRVRGIGRVDGGATALRFANFRPAIDAPLSKRSNRRR
jgi:hypothetical protein